MKKEKIVDFLKKNKIEVKGKINFQSKEEKIQFLNNFYQIIKNNVYINLINEDIKNIIVKIKINKKNLEILKQINWEFYCNFILEDKTNKYIKKKYESFIEFLEEALEIKTNKLFIYKSNFNVNQDLNEKIKKYNVEIVSNYNQEGKKYSIQDFILYFNKRLEYFSNILIKQVNQNNIIRISNLKDLNNTNEEVTIIGLISEIKYTQSNHLMITLDDKSGQIK
ncbi:MAG: hypothetical protein ACOCP8_08035 [archaeon]